ncbi:prosaposin-like [Rhopilema esculentum]|uniref:prosaposin-like n=1 Tax=Rhopilema esculentum TaxID=499914 RepID=UPI0031CFA72C|eukprot:gene5117-237_t
MKYIIFLVFVAYASAKSAPKLLGDEECTQGPSYWCKDYKTATQCGSVKYCTEHVWLKQIKGTGCDECKAVVTQIHAYLADNITEAEVIQSLDALCSFLGAYAAECKALVNTYGKEIMEMVSQYTANPELICKMLGMCTTMRTVEVEKGHRSGPIMFTGTHHVEEPKSSALCIVCEFAMTELDKVIGSESTEEKIISEVEKLCSYLPSTIKTECDALISEYGKEIIKMLVNKMKPKEICTAIKLCSAAVVKSKPHVPVKSVGNVVTCEACQLVVQYVDSLLKNKKTEAEIKQALDSMCSYLGSYQAECDSIVSNYLVEIIKYLAEMPAGSVCKALSLCTSKGSATKMTHVKLEQKAVASGTTCSTCKFATTYVDILLKNNKTEHEIEFEMTKMCYYLGSYKDECNEIIKTYLPTIIEYIADMTPEEVCKKLGLCTAKSLLVSLERKVESKKVGTYCDTCKVVVGYVDSLMKDKKTEAEIVSLVEQLCSYLGTYKEECDSLVAAYLPEIMQLLSQELSPDFVCKSLGMCGNATKIQKKEKVNGGQYCQICEVVVSYVENLLNNNTEAEIVQLVDQLCSYLGSYKDECNALVKAYVPQIIELLKKELTPALVCKELGLCTAVRDMAMKIKLSDVKKLKDGAGCQICKVIVGYVDTELKNKKTQQEITAELEQLCAYLGTYKAECQSLMTAYLPMIFQYLEQALTPDVVCKELGLCTAAKKLLVKAAFQKKSSKVKGGSYCQTCEIVVSYVESLVNSKTEAEIVAEVDQLCSFLGTYKDECKSLADTYLPQIIELLKKELTPALVCKELGLCTSFNKFAKKIKVAGVKEGATCTLCKILVGYIDKELKDSKTEAEITALVEQLCSYLGSYKAECDSLVSSYLPLIFQYLAQAMSPDLVCKELSLCTSAAPNAKMVLLKKAAIMV